MEIEMNEAILLNHEIETFIAVHDGYGDNIPLSEYDMEDTEVIGNIYENPELLEG